MAENKWVSLGLFHPTNRGDFTPFIVTGPTLYKITKKFPPDQGKTGSTISTLFHDKINPKDCQVLSLGDSGFLQFFRVVSSDYGTPRKRKMFLSLLPLS